MNSIQYLYQAKRGRMRQGSNLQENLSGRFLIKRNNNMQKIFNQILLVLFCSVIMMMFLNSCHKKPTEKFENEKQTSQLTIQQVQEKYQNQLMTIPGVIGVGIGAVNDDEVIKVLVIKKTSELEQQIPNKLEGYSVLIEETGEIRAY